MMRKPLAAADIVVLAGDVWEGGESGIEWAMEMWPFVQVLYVRGNHEYHGSDYDESCAC